jgi:hypothetical protein
MTTVDVSACAPLAMEIAIAISRHCPFCEMFKVIDTVANRSEWSTTFLARQ